MKGEPGRVARYWRMIRLLIGNLADGKLHEMLYEASNRRQGLDLDFVSVADLRLPPDRAHWHSNSGGPQLALVLKSLRIPPGSIGLDLGSGKGGAAITMARKSFASVTGVELSGDLVEIARENARRAGVENLDFIHSDASGFTALDRFTHIYLYNPFPCAVLCEVLENIRLSIKRRDRELLLIYRNPLCDDAVKASGLFVLWRQLKPAEHWWYIYRHVPSGRAST